MKPKEQNWQSQPPATVIHARVPPSGGTNGAGCGVSTASTGAAGVRTVSSGDIEVDDRGFSVDIVIRLALRERVEVYE
jgi:hypothetical protein